MNHQWSQVKIVEEILKTVGSDEEIVCQKLELAPDEYDRYREHILNRGLAVEVEGIPGVLSLTDAGRALLRLMNDIDNVFPEEETDPATCRVEVEGWSPQMGLAETIAWRDRVLQNYMLEQVEIETLEARRGQGNDEELAQELAQRQRRLAQMETLLERLGKVSREMGEPDKATPAPAAVPQTTGRTRRETVKTLVNRLFEAYVLEQADVTRLTFQLGDDDDAAGEQELDKRLRRMEILKGLLEALQRVAGNLPA